LLIGSKNKKRGLDYKNKNKRLISLENLIRSLNLKELKEIRKKIDSFINRTPCIYSEGLTRRTGKEVYLKLENLQMTGAFKARGNAYKLSILSEKELENGVVTASSGNHGLGLSRAAKLRGVKAKVLVPKNTPKIKIDKLKEYGADVLIKGDTYDEAVIEAKEIAGNEGCLYVPSFDDVDIIRGNTTLGFEIFEDVKSPGLILCPIGGGGGISGVSLARNIMSPSTQIIGVEAEGAASMFHSLRIGKRTSLKHISTLAEGIKVAQPGEIPFQLVKRYVKEVKTVAEEELKRAMIELLEQAKIVAELAGCASVAALNKIDKDSFEGPIVCVISGGNIDLELLNKILSA
jgi:threonine dehydratase